MTDYHSFLDGKTGLSGDSGFEPIEIPEFLFPFQRHLTEWAIRKGRAAVFADCGLGKTAMQLTWADNVVRHTNRPVLILTPLAVGSQTVREASKFGFDAEQSRDGKFGKRIVVANYEKLHLFKSDEFSGVVCDESSILKNAKGKTKAAVVEFMRLVPYRLLCTATAAPNDYPELGNSAEALGEMGFQDMLTRFFKKGFVGGFRGWSRPKYEMKGHAERDFWRWVCSWARACRKPSDLGFADDGYILPELITREHVVTANNCRSGLLFDMPAETIQEQAEERRRTIRERCERVAQLVDHDRPAIIWCHLNAEGEVAHEMIPGSFLISGSTREEVREEAFVAFISGQISKIVTKPELGGFGMNFQHCAHMTMFPSHSYEQYHQVVGRCRRFGQTRQVEVDIVSSEGEAGVLANLKRKSIAADVMFSRLVELMNDVLRIDRVNTLTNQEEHPPWLLPISA